jgi:hypothetical protein
MEVCSSHSKELSASPEVMYITLQSKRIAGILSQSDTWPGSLGVLGVTDQLGVLDRDRDRDLDRDRDRVGVWGALAMLDCSGSALLTKQENTTSWEATSFSHDKLRSNVVFEK